MTPASCYIPPIDSPLTVFVADDVDRAWNELGPYLMHDVLTYASWNPGNSETASLSFAKSADELRAERRSHVVLTVDEAVELIKSGVPLALHPLIGGLPRQIAWPYLEIVVDKVMPALRNDLRSP
jgi:hypothetical protein